MSYMSYMNVQYKCSCLFRKAGEFSDTVLDILGGESSHALHGILPASVGESDEPLNLSADYVLLTPVPSTPSSASIAPPGPPLVRACFFCISLHCF